ncbi:MAG: sulfatase-like hydrolase/transferase [Rhodopseudomonas palustris]|nr:sulfatase-like hydrolase/transferase [Rhodopseudomonas palustris]
MADDAIDYMTRMHQIDPSKPIFIKYAPGATHAPHHPTKEWVDKISAMKLFDDGYEKLRERIFENQKRLGVIPQGRQAAALAARRAQAAGTSSAPDEKKLFIRQVEVFAAYAAYTDHEIGRVIQAFEDLGKLDNTLIIYINGDNGTSAEGGPTGHAQRGRVLQRHQRLPADVQMKWYDVWGTEQTYNHMSAGWSWAFDTPFDWFKQNASQLGGINQNMVVSWPARIKDKGGTARAVPCTSSTSCRPSSRRPASAQPNMVDGIAQRPIEGISFAYTFDAAERQDAPSRHKTQYFEMLGQWALYHDGWIASTTPPVAPWASVAAPRAGGCHERLCLGAVQSGGRSHPDPRSRQGAAGQAARAARNVHHGGGAQSGVPAQQLDHGDGGTAAVLRPAANNSSIPGRRAAPRPTPRRRS